VLDWVICLPALVLIAVIIWWGRDYSIRGQVQSMAGLESISMFWGYVAMPVGGMFCVIGLIGNLMKTGGIARRLVEFSKSLVGGIQGGLPMTCVLTCMIFAAV
jgi:TRAP-type C4-dicarboxylate transport system permease small subunit